MSSDNYANKLDRLIWPSIDLIARTIREEREGFSSPTTKIYQLTDAFNGTPEDIPGAKGYGCKPFSVIKRVTQVEELGKRFCKNRFEEEVQVWLGRWDKQPKQVYARLTDVFTLNDGRQESDAKTLMLRPGKWVLDVAEWAHALKHVEEWNRINDALNEYLSKMENFSPVAL